MAPVTLVAATVTAAAVWTFAASRPPAGVLAGVLALLGASALAEAFPVPIEPMGTGATSLAMVFIVAGATVHGWAAGSVLALLTMVLVELSRRRRATRAIYNTAIYTLAAACAGFAAAQAPGSGVHFLVVGSLLGSAAFYAVDISLLAAVVARSREASFPSFLSRYVALTFVPFLTMASLTVILVLLWELSPLLALTLVGPLVAIAFYQRWIHAALERLREVDRLKDEFIAIASHELRTPLAAIYGAAITLEKRTVNEETQSALLSIIYAESARLARLIEEVLCASRIESGRLETAIVPAQAAELARDVVLSARATLPEGISLELHCQPRLPAVAADREKLRQVLANLVENAVRYSPNGGRIHVRLEQDQRRLRIAVSDEGIGIPADEHEQIFEKFHCVDPNVSGGTGLGLYICREFVRLMDGRIWVSSEPGNGSTFFVELPLADSLASKAPERFRPAALVRGHHDPVPARLGRS